MIDMDLIHKNEYGIKPHVVISCPGKITLSGEHTEFSDGITLSAAINRSVHVAVSPRTDNSLRIFSANCKERKKSLISNLKFKREDRWANFIKGVVYYIINAGHSFKGMNISVMGDIPEGVGLGSSSAMCLAAACCVKKLYGLDLSWLNLVESVRYSESVFMSRYAGMSDAMTSFFAKKRCFFYLDSSTLEFSTIPFFEPDKILLVTLPGIVGEESTVDLKEVKETILETMQGLKLKKNSQKLRSYTSSDIRGITGMNEAIKRKCLYITQEIKRGIESKKLLEDADYDLFGRYMNRSHEGLRDLYEVSCPEIDWLQKRALETEGIFGSKISGEAYNGCIITFMKKESLPLYEAHLDEYHKIFGFKAQSFIVGFSAGVNSLYNDLFL